MTAPTSTTNTTSKRTVTLRLNMPFPPVAVDDRLLWDAWEEETLVTELLFVTVAVEDEDETTADVDEEAVLDPVLDPVLDDALDPVLDDVVDWPLASSTMLWKAQNTGVLC
jgi:hypothetical protein